MSGLRSAASAAKSCVSSKRASDKDTHWKIWENFIARYPRVDPYLRGLSPKHQLSFLQVFADGLRSGRLAAGGKPVQSKRVQDYLRTVSEEVQRLGPDGGDPRKTRSGAVALELTQLFTAYSKGDPPPDRVKPVPIQLVLHAVLLLQATIFSRALADMIIIGFFFLLRPGEHTYTTREHTPFRLMDVSFVVGSTTINACEASTQQLNRATQVHLNFTNQKNGVKDEALTHSDNDEPLLSPLKAVRRRVLHLRQHKAPAETPLHTVFANNTTKHITSNDITLALRSSVKVIGKQIGVAASHISARALRAGGAMALLRAGVPSTEARMFGRWKSWAMIHYLHRSQTTTSAYASKMVAGGHFTIARHQHLPDDILSRLSKLDVAGHNNPALN